LVPRQLSPYSEQWYELDQLKASVRSLSQAAGLPHSPQPENEDSETLASGFSSGSVSVEALDEVGLEDSGLVPQGETTPTGRLSFVILNNNANFFHAVKCNLMELATRSTSFTCAVSGLLDMRMCQDSSCSWSIGHCNSFVGVLVSVFLSVSIFPERGDSL